MNHLKRLGLTFALMSVLAFTTLGETETPPCDPGETHGPPCSSQPLNDDSADPGETASPPAAPAVDVTDIAETLLRVLSLF